MNFVKRILTFALLIVPVPCRHMKVFVMALKDSPAKFCIANVKNVIGLIIPFENILGRDE